MIETATDYQKFLLENIEGDLFLHVIPTEENQHPVKSVPSILFIRNLSTGRTYYFSLGHSDSLPEISRDEVLDGIERLKCRKWVLDRKAFSQMLYFPSLYDVNLVGYLKENTLIDLIDYNTPSHFLIRTNSMGRGNVNLAIPLLKHLEVFDELADDVAGIVEGFVPDVAYTRFNDLIIETLGEMEGQGIFVDQTKFNEHFKIDVGEKGLTYSQYNVYTSTGRPSNRFGGVNYAALNQTDGSRRCFKSRYGSDGKMVVIDYTAFHPRIICALTKYPLSVETDIYEYLARLYFHKKDIDETDVKNSKQLTFRQLYGGVEDKYSHIKYLANLKTFIDEQWEFFQSNGYVETPFFKRKITGHHIQDPSPTKIFNYILQAVEGEIAIPKIKSVQEYLKDKRTKAVLYTYDAVLYDFHREDGFETLEHIRNLMSFDGTFPMKTYVGDTYQDVRLVSV